MTNTIDISVVMITYNHEAFVEEAILSILNQKGDFNLELIISDDKSSDNTVNIIKDIQKNHSSGNLIKLIVQDPNIGMMKNFAFALQSATGKFIAICEGDDYWNNYNKLEIQRSILNDNEDAVLSFHNAIVLNQNTGKKTNFNTYTREKYLSQDLFDQWLIPTASAFFRNVIPEKLPEFMLKGTHGDIALFLLLGQFGSFHCTNKKLSTYRINDNGVTQSGFQGINHNLKHIEQIENMMAHFGTTHKNELKTRLAKYQLSNSLLYAKEKEEKSSSKFLKKSIKNKPSLVFSSFGSVLRILLTNIKN